VLNEIEMVFEISVGAVMFFEGTADSLKVADSEGLTEAERKRHYNTSKGILKEALAQAKPILVNDEETLEEWCKLLPSLSNCRTALIMPLRGGFEVYGLLLIASNKADKYHESDLQLMVALTSHTIVAMQNATLYRNLLAERNKMLTAEEEVRHTLARNLHDGPAQAVASFSMQLEFLRRLFRSEPDRAMSELILLGKTAQQTSKEIRTLLYELRPLVLESQGLEAALEQYAARFPTNPHDPAVYFSTAGEEDIHLNSNVETTIFTILQEAVNNARKHAEAKNIWLQVEFKEGFVIAVAQDDGKGFDTSDIELNYDKRGSLGLTNMRERATLVGGKVTIESKPGKGTRVMIRIPLTTSNLASEDPIETVS
jgi:signal transduction histidine kinase